MLKKTAIGLFLLISAVSLPALADDEVGDLVIDLGDGVCSLVSADIHLPGLIGVDLCKK